MQKDSLAILSTKETISAVYTACLQHDVSTMTNCNSNTMQAFSYRNSLVKRRHIGCAVGIQMSIQRNVAGNKVDKKLKLQLAVNLVVVIFAQQHMETCWCLG